MKRLIYGSLSVLTAVSTVFLATRAEVFSAENQPSANSEDISKNITAAGLDKAGRLSSLPTATGLPGALPTDGLLSAGLTGSTKARSTRAGFTEADLAKGGLASVPKKNLLAIKGQEFQPIAGQSLIESVPARPLSYLAQTYPAQTYPAQTVPATAIPAGTQAQSTPAAKPGRVQSIPPAAASESLKPTEGDADLTVPTAPGVVPSAAPGLIPGRAPETLIVPATPTNMAPEEDPISEEDSAPAADLAPAEGLSPEVDLTPEAGSFPAGDSTPEENVAPEGQVSPPLSPMPREGTIRQIDPSVTPVTPDDSSFPPAGISPTGVPSTGFPSEEAAPVRPLPPIPVAPSVEEPSSMDPSADLSAPSMDPSGDPSIEPQPIEPRPRSPLPPTNAPANDSAVPNESPVSGSSSDRLVGEGFTPFQLAYLALAGGLKEEGIPGGTQLVSAYKQGDLSAEDVVAAGATSKRLGTAASDQADYTNSVDRFLTIFRKDARSSK